VVIPGCLAALAAAEWLRSGLAAWAWAAGLAGLAALIVALVRERRRVGAVTAAVTALSLGIVLVVGEFEVRRVECCWPALRERRVAAASDELKVTLAAAVAFVRRLADRGAAAARLPRDSAFDALAAALRRESTLELRHIDRGVVILEGRNGPEGEPWAWAGRHRFVPAMDTTEIRAVITPFYVSLEARRQTQTGAVAVASVLLDAAPAAPDRGRTVSAVFAQAHGVGLRFLPPHLAPPGSDVSDFTAPPPRRDTLFSVQAIPPSQGDARLATLGEVVRLAGLLLAVTVPLLFATASPGRGRWGVALAGAWCLMRAPLGPTGRLAAFFSPATFYRPLLGLFSSSAGSLTLFAALVLFAAAFFWRRGFERRWWSIGPAGLLLVAAPYLVRNLGRGITPPARGVGFALWLSWEATLAVASMALILIAAALVRGSREPRRVPWTLPAAGAWALVVAVAGLWLWEPNDAWPEWYTFLWLPALAGVVVPAPRRWAVVAIATVAGTAAALITWGAAIEGRIALADRDARGLGREGDPLAAVLLERMGPRATALVPAPRTAGELYSLWLESPLAQQDYPAVLSVWTRSGDPEAELPLAALDLPPALMAAFVRSPVTPQGPRVERVEAIPGVEYVLIAPLSSGAVLAIAVGPRSRLLPSSRVARFLQGEMPATPPYVISLSPPQPTPPVATAGSSAVVWTREGWSARGERRVDLPGGLRHIHARVDLRGPWPLLVRGVLVVLFDVALLAGVWLVGVVLARGVSWRLPPVVSAFRTSYRVRLAGVLAGFLVVPVLAFAIWSFARLRDEARGTRDLLIRQALKDAAVTAAGIPVERPEAAQRAVEELGTRLDADLWLYRDGVLAAASTPVLSELGLVDAYLEPPVFRRLALEDELEATADGRSAGRPIRVGYRVIDAGPPASEAILAAPQLLDDESLRQQQEDLVLTLVLAICAGLGAAVYLAGVAASALARPVAALRRAADAVGRGSAPPAFPPGALREFEPVMSAFQRMAADVRSSQDALEEARHRTAQVLANVATGVIAVERDLRVTLANGRAADLVGGTLEPGDVLPQATGDEWQPVWSTVRDFLDHSGDGSRIRAREFAVGARQIRVQIASLGPAPEGCVIALDDATDATRAARVLAWGEMARQVAHEIKNPLTPIRLGIQHLQRARKRENFDATLRETATRILAEIDRLDAIARTFSRFGSPAAETLPLEPVDLHALAREVVQLYSLGGVGGAARFEFSGAGGSPVLARRDEVKEVLVNLLENARNAGARQVTVHVAEGREVSVADDGRGIPDDALPRVFEPTFSTTSSGAGLGLAIAKRLVDSWGGTIAITSRLGVGTTVTITLVPDTPRQGAA
jgi:two-component system, NtrC family, nitrogen regulation sensor histidine kinase NtrY